MSRPTGRGKIAAKLAASANQNGQENNGDRDEWTIVPNPQKGLQDEWTTTTDNTEKTNGDDSWGTGGFTGAWGTDASSAGQTTTNTSYPATSEPECRHCEGPHLSSECPERRNGSGGGGGGGGGGRGCFNCGSTDHIKRDCPQNRGDRSYGENRSYGGGRSQGGYGSPEGQRSFGGNRSYGEGRSQGGFRSPEGQRSYGRDRSYGNERSPGDTNSYRNDTNCSNCGGRGHNASKCPSPPERGYDSAYGGSQSSRNSGPSQQSEISCYRCQETGHLAHQCPKRVGALTNTENTGPSMRIVETTEAEAENRNCIGDMSRFEGTQVKVLDSSGEQITKFNGKVLNSFRDGGLCETLLEMLDKLGFEKPMPVQKYAIPILAEGYDIMACAQTGSGKTAAFILPIVNDLIRDRRIADKGLPQRPYGLVLSPTRELCAQITKDAQQYCLRTCPKIKVKECYGGVSIFQQKRNIMEGCHLLVGTTGRTKQFIRDNVISLSELRYLVLDEADRMLDMGFHAEVTDILRYRSQENPLQTLMFSATFPEDVQSLARECLKPDFVKLDVGMVGMVNKDVQQTIEQVSGMDAKQDRLQEIIEEDIRNDKRAKILVFTSTKLCADMLAIYLSGAGVKTTSMHGDRYQEQREKALDDFQNGTCPVLVATEVAGRGLDITDVTHVINFDLPKDLDGYVHRVGRTARAGKTGRATSFFDPNKDQHIQERLRQLLVDAGAVPPPFL